MSLENVAHPVLGTAQADAFGGLDERALDQDRVRDHRIEQPVIVDVGRGQTKFGGQRLFGA